VGCGGLPAAVLEAELFGSAAGGPGKLEAARGATIYLDEVEEIPIALQARIARFLEAEDASQYRDNGRVGNVRMLSSSAVDLKDRVTREAFRDDLYFRLSVVGIHLPSLSERKQDIAYLAHRFLDRYAGEFGRGNLTFGRDALRALQRFPWPGNVRELEHRVQRGIVLARGRVIRTEDLELDSEDPVDVMTLRAAREWGERKVVVDALRRNCGNIARASRDLEISRPTLHDLLRKLEIRAGDYKKGLGPEESATPA
jgi:two-component system NtrC family response regulator